jgi:protease I
MATVLIPVPRHDFDPTETAVPCGTLRQHGHRVVFATPDGTIADADPRMVTGEGLGIFAPLMKADRNGGSAYEAMRGCEEFRHPASYGDLIPEHFDGIILPGGHAPGMRQYLESIRLQSIIADFFRQNRPVGAICHGVLPGGALPQTRRPVGSLWKKDDCAHQIHGVDSLGAHSALSWRLLPDVPGYGGG